MISKEAVVAYFDTLQPYLCESTEEIRENMKSKFRATAEIETFHLTDTVQKSCPLRLLIRVSCYTKFCRNPCSGCSTESCGRTDQLSAQVAVKFIYIIKMTDILIKNEGLMKVFCVCGNNVNSVRMTWTDFIIKGKTLS